MLSAPGVNERAQLAASGKYLAKVQPRKLTALDDPDWAGALDIPDIVTEATLEGTASAAGVLPNLGVIQPVRGTSFVMLSTGILGTVPEPGTDFFPVGPDGDLTALHVKLHVPPGVNRMSLEYNFLSAEYPEFVGSAFNDAFTISIIAPSGRRDFPVESVNSTRFFPVSASRAKNSGFDIYAVDPSLVDTEFDGINPDAGLTDFQVFSKDVPSDTDIELVFTIQDAGDGILDSAVLIDAIQFSALQTLDANPDFIAPDATVVQDAEQLGDETRGRPVRAAVADGVTKVVLRVKVPDAGTVMFSLLDAGLPVDDAGVALDGGLSLDGNGPRQASVQGQTIHTATGNDYGIAVYQVPVDFNRCPDPPDPANPPPCADDALTERTITVKATYTPQAGIGFDTQLDLQIKRPPVVLAHGLWTSPVEWQGTPLGDDPRFSFTYTDYIYECDNLLRIVDTGKCPMVETTSLSQSRVVCQPSDGNSISDAVHQAIANSQRLGVAATQVDLVAHGAAGILAREYIAREPGPGQLGYINLLNLNQGDVHRLITWDTPHTGSPIANRIVAARDTPAVALTDDLLCTGAVTSNPVSPIEKHGIDDLMAGQVSLPSTPVPSHALVGTVPSALTPQVVVRKVGGRGKLYSDVATADNVTMFGPAGADLVRNHDLFSTVDSQRGGLPDSAVTSFTMTPSPLAGPDPDFFYSIKSVPMSQRVLALLNRRVDSQEGGGNLFDNFADSAGFAARTPLAIRSDAGPVVPAAPLGGIHIATPVDGTNVISGGTVTVEVVVDGDFVPANVSVTLGDSVLVKNEPPFQFTLPVPGTVLGSISLFAIAFDANDVARVSNVVQLDAQTNATVNALRIVTQDPVLSKLGSQRQLVVVGDYNDGFTRAIAAAGTGTVYASSTPSVVTVSPDGVITAVGRGFATISAQNGLGFDSITVTVEGNHTPIPKAGHSVALTCVAAGHTVPVQLDGSGSFDPDGDPLTFTWFDGTVQIATGPTPTVTLGAGEHDLQLVVSDGISDPANSTVHVSIEGDTQPPRLTVLGDTPSTVECSAPFTDPGATALDACDGDLTAAVTAASNVDTRVVGNYQVTYQVHDSAGLTATATRPVVVADRTPPVVSVVGPNPAPLECGTAFQDTGATALDACDGDLTAAVTAVSHVQPGVPGSYTVDYQVHDKTGLTGTASRSVLVADHIPPVIALRGPDPLLTECAAPFVDPGATATDLCSGDLTGAIQVSSNVNPAVVGSYHVTYRVADQAQLSGVATRSVLVVDRTPPHVTIAPMRELFPPDLAYREFTLSDCASAFDTCGGRTDIDRAGEIVAIHSDEPDSVSRFDPGHDIVILGHSRFLLRSQSNPFGNGRVYEIEFTVHDAQGNATGSQSCFIGVPSLEHRNRTPIDDGRVFTVLP